MLSATALTILVGEHPALLSLRELARILRASTDGWRDLDAIDVAAAVGG
ncbi:MAG: hypothetical protein Q8O56_18240 [Solirubrobacteraceae bacterium]|nr:hypothetical protein [Solirubrobacteraceae bacterium]